MSEYLFLKETHEYFIDGVLVPSVSQILKAEGIIDTRWYSPESANFGTFVHEALEAVDLGIVSRDAFTDIQPYVDAWIRFKDEFRYVISPDGIERQLFSEQFGYAGTLDRIGEITAMSIHKVLVDIKTGRKEPWHGIQLSAYALAAGEPDAMIMSVYLNRSGKYYSQQWPVDESMLVWKSILTVQNWRRTHGKRTDFPGDQASADGT